MKKIAACIAIIIMLGCNTGEPETVVNTEDTVSAAVNNSGVPQPDTISHAGRAKNNNAAIMAKKQVPVICYHQVKDGEYDDYAVSPASFEQQVKAFTDSGFHSILPDQLYNYLVYNDPLPDKPIMITFDDADKNQYSVAAPIIEKYGIKGVFFITGFYVDKIYHMATADVKDLEARGHVIANHTWTHPVLTKINAARWQKEINGTSAFLQNILGHPVDYFAYSFGIYNKRTEALLDKSFKLSFILSTHRDPDYPLQTIRRMIVPYNWTPNGIFGAMRKTFGRE